MQYIETVMIAASPAQVFAVLAAVANWADWDPEVEAASLEGSFSLGAVGKIKPKGAPESKITIVELSENKSVTVECKLPLCKMQFVHQIEQEGDQVKVVHTVVFAGMLAWLFGRLIGKPISKTLPQSLAALKQHVEGKDN